MAKFVSNRDETIRLFKNPILEYFSHIHPATPLFIFLPIIGAASFFGFPRIGVGAGILAFLAGIFLWTIFEYVFHRWVFHYHPKSEIGKSLHFLVHGIHHDYPRDSTRLVMPLLVSLPLSIMFFYLFQLAFGQVYFLNIFAGFLLGYVAYDSIHYATHHMSFKGSAGKFLKEYHLRHHYNDEHTAYGVSNPLWDYIFSTVPDRLKKTKEEQELTS